MPALYFSPVTETLERLFRTYHASLVRYLQRALGDRDVAEELAQETFVRALKQGELRSERSWLFAVATNLVRDETRRDGRARRRLERYGAEQPQAAEPAPTTVERAEGVAVARAALAALSDRDRDALLLQQEGMGYPEIAAALRISVGSVGTTLSRARRRLLEAYEAQQRADESGSPGGRQETRPVREEGR
jgi:RNA polymerase sigma-70 factor (ECF subfamily)